ncbi:MAG: PilW family protein [Methylococcales bacterium]|nr:PilW family protein [Methylococcales bacterium]
MRTLQVNTKQSGMTLIEIMIAMLIGVFLLGGVMQIFMSSRQSYRMQDNLSRMQENGRFAMDFLTRDIRMVGHQGCSTKAPKRWLDPKNPNPNPMPMTMAADGLGIIGKDNVSNNWNTGFCGASGECTQDTDVFSAHYGNVCSNLSDDQNTPNANIQIPVPNQCDIKKYDVLLISDCKSADIFIATSASKGGVKQTIAHANNQNTSSNLLKGYKKDAQLFKLNAFSYFIRKGKNGQPALWRMNNTKRTSGNNPVELIEGIENMQILYGEDTNKDKTPDYYLAAETMGLDMSKVVSVRVELLTVSHDDNLTLSPVTYTFNQQEITSTDKRLRQVFSSTIALRNRLP